MQKSIVLTFISFLTTISLFAQSTNWQERAEMPEAVSNNAVAYATVGGEPYVFSFAGIDETKQWSGIHKRAFRYNVNADTWETIPELPSGNGRIAAGASTVNNKIYIIGGYEVFADGHEVSYDKVHIYDPETNSYLPDGAAIPIPIDDHVQAIYKDSLIYVVTGWSNNNNVNAVQIYDPANDTWSVGTSVPNNGVWEYKVFGASGAILGDTIYYTGGAKFGSNFPMTSALRKGAINPDDPTEITWSTEFNTIAKTYRAGIAVYDPTYSNGEFVVEQMLIIGGASTSYNYDGLAYSNGQGVEPVSTLSELAYGKLFTVDSTENSLPIMDLRGVGYWTDDLWTLHAIVAGGMLSDQTVSNKTSLMESYSLINTETVKIPPIKIHPNPATNTIFIDQEGAFQLRLFNTNGELILDQKVVNQRVDVSMLTSGMYFLSIGQDGKQLAYQKLVIE